MHSTKVNFDCSNAQIERICISDVVFTGLTLATTWASASSYISLIAPPQFKSTAQSLLMLLYHGIGKGFGSIVGGFIIKSAGKGRNTSFNQVSLESSVIHCQTGWLHKVEDKLCMLRQRWWWLCKKQLAPAYMGWTLCTTYIESSLSTLQPHCHHSTISCLVCVKYHWARSIRRHSKLIWNCCRLERRGQPWNPHTAVIASLQVIDNQHK